MADKKIIFGIAILFIASILPAASAAINAEISFDTERVVLEQGQTISVIATVKNVSDPKPICFSLKTSTSSFFDIEAKLPDGLKQVCLNEGESTKFSLAIHAFDDAANDDYTATLRASDPEGTASKSIVVEVREDVKNIDLIASEKSICRNRYNQSLSVLVKNNMASRQAIKLTAGSELFLPFFEPEEITLNSGDERFVELKINVNKTIALGKYVIPIFARTNSKFVESRAEFNVIDCEAPKPKILELSLPQDCITIDKGKSKVVSFRVKNLGNEFQTVFLATTGDLPSDLRRKNVVIEPRNSTLVDLNVHAENVSSGKHFVGVWAWNGSDRVGSQFCVEVGKIHGIEVNQLNNNVSVPRDEAEIIAFEVTNIGDFTETVSANITNNNSNVTITTQNPTITLAKGETKTVFVVISPNLRATLGAKTATVTFSIAGQAITKAINFIVEQEIARQKINVLKIIEYPQRITAAEGEKRNYQLTIENPTTERVAGLTVIITGLPDGITASAVTGISLGPGERKTVNGTIEFSEGTAGEYNAQFELENREYKTTQAFAITINQGIGGALAGLLGFASSVGLGLLVLAIIVLLALLISKNGELRKKEQAWLAEKQGIEQKECWQAKP